MIVSEWPCTSVVTKAPDAETEAKTEAEYLKTDAEAQGSWPILLTVSGQNPLGQNPLWQSPPGQNPLERNPWGVGQNSMSLFSE